MTDSGKSNLVKNRLVPKEVFAVLLLDGAEDSPKLGADVRTERSQHYDGAPKGSLKS
jgi:hypothetical protein